jgi:hypothetical protein
MQADESGSLALVTSKVGVSNSHFEHPKRLFTHPNPKDQENTDFTLKLIQEMY